jgi:nucleotide-binding universal stress UspA family protein
MNALPTRIVLATDGSADAALATRAAMDLSSGIGAQLYVAHAWRLVPPYVGYPRLMGDDYGHLYEREARRFLESQVDAIEDMGGAVAEPRLLKNPPIDAILDLCEELGPDLLVMGSRGVGPLRRIPVGSVCEGVVHHARCPVLVVRGGSEAWPPRRVVVGDDGSDAAEKVGELAADIGKLFGAPNVLVRAYQNPPEPLGGWSSADRSRLNEVLLQQEEVLKERAEVLGNRTEVRAIEGDAATAILDVAAAGDERKTLVAVGSRGLGVTGRARFGSVSSKVFKAARGPVLVRPDAQRDSRATSSERYGPTYKIQRDLVMSAARYATDPVR